MENIALYVHWPICKSKCHYCDFFSIPICQVNWDNEKFITRYLDELSAVRRPVSSVFFGGGTPSLMPLSLVEKILQNTSLVKGAEISMEVNPDSIDLNQMKALRDMGVNRLSIGVQSLKDEVLKFFGRPHDVKQALKAIENGKKVFDNISIDLIYARPHQGIQEWLDELRQAVDFGLPHYSLYELILEKGTKFENIEPPDEEITSQMLIETWNYMDKVGIPFYEVSNFAKVGYQCQHNLVYWRGGDYIGIGAGAHGRIGNRAIENPCDIDLWMAGEQNRTQLSQQERLNEKIMMGLRLREGMELSLFKTKDVQKALLNGWITMDDYKLYPTQNGLLWLNQLILCLGF